MSTNLELQQWLKRFPDDAKIEVVVGTRGSVYYGDNYYQEELILPDVQQEDISWSNSEFDNVEFCGLDYNYEENSITRFKTICLGKSE
jgi:hypothetical protein